ncbi:hypothetical protein XENOCAPTIV_020678 [Xenoophorus captivus]|uniref:Hydroxyacid-oxoacid transhydrogenase, mitochondrial n=1 Tax=Xenoophorus captivus TaxID=1517983 RepID=A0ABV0RWR1_9TELE
MLTCELFSFSFKDAIAFAKKNSFDAFVAVGGGSVIDTCKAANLYSCHSEADFLDFVNAPIGKGRPVTKALKPLIAGIASRAIRPMLGIVDPLHTLSMPERVTANSGFDVLWAVWDPEDLEARSSMHLASVFAGIGFGNAGVHLWMFDSILFVFLSHQSWDVISNRRKRENSHSKGLQCGASPSADTLRQFLFDLHVEDGLAAVGYNKDDIPALVKGTLPQVSSLPAA